MSWKLLSDQNDLLDMIQESENKPVLFFKHSTRCEISTIAKMRLDDSKELSNYCTMVLVDVIRQHELSKYLADNFSVQHESPQIILISNNDCILDASHLDVHTQEIIEVIGHEIEKNVRRN